MNAAAAAVLTSRDRELDEVLAGLSATPPRVAPRYFYDARGSHLFGKITETPEYYPTRTELAILQQRGADIAATIGRPDARWAVIELGSGSGEKVLALLSHLGPVSAYRPIDISATAVDATAAAVRAARPALDVRPYRGDFTDPKAYAGLPAGAPKLVYYSGSTIGNFEPSDAVRFLRDLRAQLCPGDCLLLATDLIKEKAVLDRAYNDRAGYTAAFNKNLLAHLNARFGADFMIEAFDHLAFYNEAKRRIEMHLVPESDQRVHIGGETLTFKKSQPIHTECSYKFDRDQLRSLAQKSGFELTGIVTDEREWFAESIMHVPAVP